MGASKCFANSEIHLISVSSIVSYTIRDSQGGFREDNVLQQRDWQSATIFCH